MNTQRVVDSLKMLTFPILQSNVKRFTIAPLILTLTILPILNITTIIATTGSNILSSDDIAFVTRFLQPLLEGTYDFRNYIVDSFFNTHSLIFPGLTYIAATYLTRLNLYAILFWGIILAILRLWLLYDAFTHSDRGSLNRLWLLPLLAALIFSVSQITLFEHGLTSMPMGLNLFGFVLGIWGLSRFPRRWLGVWIMVAGGVVATLSFASGLLAWPVFLLGLVLLNFRRFAYYVVWVGGAALTFLPYILVLVILSRSAQKEIQSITNVPLMLQLVGSPLGQADKANLVGCVGIGLCVIGLILLWYRRKALLVQSVPALLIIAYSILNIWQIIIFRGTFLPWYTFIGMLFWTGLLGLAYTLWIGKRVQCLENKPFISKATRLWSLSILATFVLLYSTSNINYVVWSFFLRTRSPVSAACVRNYQIAPTYCETTLTIWPPGAFPLYTSVMGQPLEQHHLSVFAPHQQWTLQGDFILNNVHTYEKQDVIDIFWSADRSSTPIPWSDYRHLNLFLHSPNTISWTVSLPPSLKKAEFHSAVTISTSVPYSSIADGATFEVYIERIGHARQLAFSQYIASNQHEWSPFTIPLSAYAGETITLHLTSNPGANYGHDWTMYRYPFIDVFVETPASATDNVVMDSSRERQQNNQEQQQDTAKSDRIITPSNTELFPALPKTTANDFRFDITNSDLWQTSSKQPIVKENETIKTSIVSKELKSPQYEQTVDNLCLADYSYFYARLAASEKLTPQALQIDYKLNDLNDFHESRSIKIPLIVDSKMHAYTYDLRLLELNHQSRLTGIRLVPFIVSASTRLASEPKESWVKVSDFRLLHTGNPSECTPVPR